MGWGGDEVQNRIKSRHKRLKAGEGRIHANHYTYSLFSQLLLAELMFSRGEGLRY